MSLPPGSSERKIRAAVVDHIREKLPRARVVHELKCNGRRADVAAVERNRLLLFEIKSEKDTLARAKAQLERFSQSSHGTVLVLHEKHFDHAPYHNGRTRCVSPVGRHHNMSVWIYPKGAARGTPTSRTYAWTLPRPQLELEQPAPAWFLGLLWRAELLRIANRYDVLLKSRDNKTIITRKLVWGLTGGEVCHGVCAALRSRPFAYADRPISDRVTRLHYAD